MCKDVGFVSFVNKNLVSSTLKIGVPLLCDAAVLPNAPRTNVTLLLGELPPSKPTIRKYSLSIFIKSPISKGTSELKACCILLEFKVLEATVTPVSVTISSTLG